jgi:hypothetical protein
MKTFLGVKCPLEHSGVDGKRLGLRGAQGLKALVGLLSSPCDPGAVYDSALWLQTTQVSALSGVSAVAAFTARPYASREQRIWCDEVLSLNWRRFDRNFHYLQHTLELLDHAGIQSLVLKGPLLAQRHYHPPFLRKTSLDIDLAVRECDIDRVCSVLKSDGYVQSKSLQEAKAYGYDLTLLHESAPRVELHFRLSHGASGIPVEEFFDRSRTVRLPNGTSARILGEADEILHLVLHYAHHRFPLLFNLYEIRLIWNRASAETRNEAIRRAVQHGFFGAFAMTDVAFRVIWKEAFLPTDRPLPQTWLHWRINENLYWQCVDWSSSPDKLTFWNRLRGRWLDFQVTDRPSDALKFAAMFFNVAWFRLKQRGWRTMKYRHFTSEE